MKRFRPALLSVSLLVALSVIGCFRTEVSQTFGPGNGLSDSASMPKPASFLAKVAMKPCPNNPGFMCRETSCPVSCPAPAPVNWTLFGEPTFEVAANRYGEVYGLTYRATSPGGYRLSKFSAGGAREDIAAGLMALDVQGDILWGVNTSGWIFRHAYPVTGLSWEHVGFRVNGVSGYLAKEIATGAFGNIFVLSTETVNGGNKLYKYSGSGDAWSLVAAGLVQIDVDNNGALWGVNSSGWVFRHGYPVTGTAWEHIGFRVNGQFGYLARTVSVGNGKVLALSTEAVSGGYKVYQYSGSGEAWDPVADGLATLSVNQDGNAWGANTNEQMFQSP